MSLRIFRGQHWIEKILKILLQTGSYEQFSGQLRRITGIRALTQKIWLTLYKVSVVSLCGTGVAAASLSTVKSRGCTVGESAAYRFIGRVPGLSFVVMFRTVFWGTLWPYIVLQFLISFTCFSDSLCAFQLEGVTWVNPCNLLWCEPVGSRIWKLWSKQMV